MAAAKPIRQSFRVQQLPLAGCQPAQRHKPAERYAKLFWAGKAKGTPAKAKGKNKKIDKNIKTKRQEKTNGNRNNSDENQP